MVILRDISEGAAPNQGPSTCCGQHHRMAGIPAGFSPRTHSPSPCLALPSCSRHLGLLCSALPFTSRSHRELVARRYSWVTSRVSLPVAFLALQGGPGLGDPDPSWPPCKSPQPKPDATPQQDPAPCMLCATQAPALKGPRLSLVSLLCPPSLAALAPAHLSPQPTASV